MPTIFRSSLLILLFIFMQPSQAARLIATISDDTGEPVSNAVVVLIAETGTVPPARKGMNRVIDQIDKEFINRVTAIQTGTLIEFPNNDDIRHHVYSFSPAKPFELPLYSGTPAEPVLFDKPGIVKIGCNIHDWMIGYIYVSDSPYIAVTGDDGKAEIDGIVDGDYIARTWHPLMKQTEDSSKQTIEIRDGVTTTLSWDIELKADIRPRRSPVPVSRGYR